MENKETTIVENNLEVVSQPIKKKSNKKKFVRILIPIPVVFFLIVLVLGIVSFVNYNC